MCDPVGMVLGAKLLVSFFDLGRACPIMEPKRGKSVLALPRSAGWRGAAVPATGWHHTLDGDTNNRHHDPDENEGENGSIEHALSMPEGYPAPECKPPSFSGIPSWLVTFTKMSFDSRQVLVSCEHASNRLPEDMKAPPEMMALHIAWDPGALKIARRLAETFSAPLHAGEYSRLVVDLNRTIGNSVLVRRVSDGHRIPFNRGLRRSDVQRRIEDYYLPYRTAVLGAVEGIIQDRGRCVHLCIHTYTPQLGDNVRGNDIGLLYDPHRQPEAALVHELRDALIERTGLVVWLNRPYQGTADGILPRIREVYDAEAYVGIELEVNQRFADSPTELVDITDAFSGCVQDLCGWKERDGKQLMARKAS